MKKIVKRLFFFNTPAKGAVFAITMIGPVILWCNLFYLLGLWNIITLTALPGWSDYISPVWQIVQSGLFLIFLYIIVLSAISLWRIGKALWKNRNYGVLCPMTAMLLCLAAGAIAFFTVFDAIRVQISYITGCDTLFIEERMAELKKIFGSNKQLWSALFYLSLLFFLAAYCFFAKIAAMAEKIKWRQVFGKATLTLWAIFLLSYLFSIGLAVNASYPLAKQQNDLESYFGHPLTAKALGRIYHSAGKVDNSFWKQKMEIYEKLPSRLQIGGKEVKDWKWDLKASYPKEFLPEIQRYCQQNSGALALLGSGLDQLLPLPEHIFKEGVSLESKFDTLFILRQLASWQRTCFFMALQKNKLPQAFAAYHKLGNIEAVAGKGVFLLENLVWLRIVQLRLDCMEKFLESQCLSDSELAGLEDELNKLESAIPVNHRRTIYSEAITYIDFMQVMKNGLSEKTFLSLGEFRYAFPLIWYHMALDCNYFMHSIKTDDFSKIDSKNAALKLYIFSDMLLGTSQLTGNKFHAATARIRAMKGIIKAEKYRRKHGCFPQTLTDLPIDPFTGKSLQYRCGKTQVSESTWVLKDGKYCEQTRIVSVPAVQVWSVGPDRKDNLGADYDDIRALRRY